ncbi:MAG: AAA family ATPase [Treponema sp.]|jgi:KaiC/GvpD/RAD55 family RecA-like ATPase|nr:AAA family ATPase [Treponema sp.]
MVKSELIQRSPIRLFEQSIHGGLKAGETGIIASPNGVGKTSVLVQLALDKLLQGKKVIHVSFTLHTHYVPVWYEDIFEEIINKKNLESAAEIKNEAVKNRVLMNFNQDGVTIEQIIKSLRAMIMEGGFKADSVIIDGFDFSRMDNDCLVRIKNFATELGVSIWLSCSVMDGGQQYDSENIPLVIGKSVSNVDVVIVLNPKNDHVELSVSKDRDSVISKSIAMKLDPKTLLILEA